MTNLWLMLISITVHVYASFFTGVYLHKLCASMDINMLKSSDNDWTLQFITTITALWLVTSSLLPWINQQSGSDIPAWIHGVPGGPWIQLQGILSDHLHEIILWLTGSCPDQMLYPAAFYASTSRMLHWQSFINLTALSHYYKCRYILCIKISFLYPSHYQCTKCSIYNPNILNLSSYSTEMTLVHINLVLS